MTYMEALFTRIDPRIPHPPPGRHESTGPCAQPLAIHQFGDGPAMDRFHWGYAPSWWKRDPVTNAPLRTLLRGSAVWRPLLARRVLVPADGWYQPSCDEEDNACQYLHAPDGIPLYIAAITAWRPGNAHGKQDGLAIITDEAGGLPPTVGRPVVLPVEAARLWMDPATPIIDALQLACTPWLNVRDQARKLQ
ncbi:SOS response-associated peptidase family protein [Bordetella petrii]|nr:SOS response-associated peptidase family protein [Bordetella petrii]